MTTNNSAIDDLMLCRGVRRCQFLWFLGEETFNGSGRRLDFHSSNFSVPPHSVAFANKLFAFVLWRWNWKVFFCSLAPSNKEINFPSESNCTLRRSRRFFRGHIPLRSFSSPRPLALITDDSGRRGDRVKAHWQKSFSNFREELFFPLITLPRPSCLTLRTTVSRRCWHATFRFHFYFFLFLI